MGKKSVIFAHFSQFSPFFVILHFQNYFCHIKTFYLYFSLLFKLVDLVFCQFSCHFRHFSAFLGFFCAPRPPIWHHFEAIFGHTFQKISIFLIFSIIFEYTYMVLGRRAVVLANECLNHLLSFRVMPENASRAEICSKFKKMHIFEFIFLTEDLKGV